MRNKIILAAAAAIAAAYIARWHHNYTQQVPEGEVDLPVPDDIAGPVDLTDDELDVLDEIEDLTCMQQCCVDYDEISAYYETE